MFTKVCGLVSEEQIDNAIKLGYDAIGIVTYKKSKRFCSDEKAVRLAEYARGRIQSFVVGVTYEDVKKVADAFDIVQIYEAKKLPALALSSKERPPENTTYKYFIYDASTGSGVFKAFPNWLSRISGKLILAGGLNPENVGSVIREFKPFGVDVSSGVEKQGVKDYSLMKQFIEAVRKNAA